MIEENIDNEKTDKDMKRLECINNSKKKYETVLKKVLENQINKAKNDNKK